MKLKKEHKTSKVYLKGGKVVDLKTASQKEISELFKDKLWKHLFETEKTKK